MVLVDLQAVQADRLTALDPLLPPVLADPTGADIEVLTAALPGGEVRGLLKHTVLQPGSPMTTWSMLARWDLFPLLGTDPGAGMDALLRAWRRRMDAVDPRPGDDSACVVVWPSRDTLGSQPLLRHGFQPLVVLAVRTVTDDPAGPPPPAGLTVRRATIADLDAAVHVAQAEMAYAVTVGNTIIRPDAPDIQRTSLGRQIGRGDPVMLAEQDGAPVGLAVGSVIESDPAVVRSPVPAGRWGYIGLVSVLPGARSGGVGRALMAAAHRELDRLGVTGTHLYYGPANPLSSVFWPRQGYRPLWTTWETRPAWALR
ncbi:MAG TPA: GNAT family N-acetyltransferase [Pseudonocardiaceae bacterium]